MSHKTVVDGNHMTLARRYPYERVERGPMWVQICHDRNIRNQFRCAPTCKWSDISDLFGG